MRKDRSADLERENVPVRDLAMQLRRRGVQRIGRRHRRPGLVFDPNRTQIHVVLAGVIRGVVLAHELSDAPILPHDVMCGEDAGGIFEAPYGALEHHDRPVVDDELDRVALAAHRVVALWDGAAPFDAHGGLTRRVGRS